MHYEPLTGVTFVCQVKSVTIALKYVPFSLLKKSNMVSYHVNH